MWALQPPYSPRDDAMEGIQPTGLCLLIGELVFWLLSENVSVDFVVSPCGGAFSSLA